MRAYVRPPIVEMAFFDNNGRAIEYGTGPVIADAERRSGTNVYVNQDRYLPIFTIADALVAHIQAEYDVVVEEVDTLPDYVPPAVPTPPDNYSRIIRLVPARPDQATMTICFGHDPGVIYLFVGYFAQFDMWFCGCDACAEPWQQIADSLEDVLLSVIRGTFTEVIDLRWRGRVRYWLDRERPHEWTGSFSKRMVRPEALRETAATLKSLPNGRWAGYTARSASSD